VNYVCCYDSIRFVNWLQNGQGSGDTEGGTYTITGGGQNSGTVAIPSSSQRTTWAATDSLHYLLPSENEWYKAAYYKGGGTNTGYWTYPTRSNTAPINILSSTGTNNANFYDSHHTGTGGYTTGSPYLTDVGAFAASPGPYGTFDQGGDVLQLNETEFSSSLCLRGGYWDDSPDEMASYSKYWDNPTNEGFEAGFRVAMVVPEPGSLTLVVCGAIAGLIWWKRRS
jgi:formylglycine-generating enzyme required for sulfatase activity